jgi:hypothetical protein
MVQGPMGQCPRVQRECGGRSVEGRPQCRRGLLVSFLASAITGMVLWTGGLCGCLLLGVGAATAADTAAMDSAGGAQARVF